MLTQLSNYMPWIALVVAIIAVFARDGIRGGYPGAKRQAPLGAFIMLALVSGAAMFAAYRWPDFGGGLMPVVTGFAIGVLLSAISHAVGLIHAQHLAGRTGPIALSATAVAFAGFVPEKAAFALVFGAAVSSWLMSIGKAEEPNAWAGRSAIAAGAIVACNALATRGIGSEFVGLGTVLALLACLAGVIGGAVSAAGARPQSGQVRSGMLAAVVTFALLAGGAYALGSRLSLPFEATMVFIGSLALALIVGWLMPNDLPPSPVRTLVAAIVWIAAGSIAFGFQKVAGMSLALLGGGLMLILLGRRQALLSLGILASLVLYRVFRSDHTSTVQAFDIGQHYAMIGVLLGAMLPLIAQEWLRNTAKRGGGTTLLAGVLWIALLAVAPVPIAVALSVKGVVGYVIGLGLGAVFEGLRGEDSAHSLSIAMGLGFAMAVAYDWVGSFVDMDRSHKLVALAWFVGIGIVAAALIVFLSSEIRRRTSYVTTKT